MDPVACKRTPGAETNGPTIVSKVQNKESPRFKKKKCSHHSCSLWRNWFHAGQLWEGQQPGPRSGLMFWGCKWVLGLEECQSTSLSRGPLASETSNENLKTSLWAQRHLVSFIQFSKTHMYYALFCQVQDQSPWYMDESGQHGPVMWVT
jgi:hypothetical protein